MLRGLRDRFPLYSISPKARSDIPRQQSFTLGDLTPAKWDFILLSETASQSLRLPSQHFAIRRVSAAFTAFAASLGEIVKQEEGGEGAGFSSKGEVRAVVPIHESSGEEPRWSLHSGEIYVVFPLGRASRPALRFNRRGEKDLSPIWRQEEEEEEEAEKEEG